MVKYLKQNKVVMILGGKYAGKKAVIIRCYDDGQKGDESKGTVSRSYGHALVCGLAAEPRKLKRRDTNKRKEKKCRLKVFIKFLNYNHMMPTRYTLDMDLKAEVTPDCLEDATKKKEALKAAREKFGEKYKTGKNKWFFSKLYF